jgi:MFS family permease
MIEGGLQTFGVACGQLIGYGFFYVKGQAQWRVPVGIQLIPALIVFVFINFVPESPRWLIKQGHIEQVCSSAVPITYRPPEKVHGERLC